MTTTPTPASQPSPDTETGRRVFDDPHGRVSARYPVQPPPAPICPRCKGAGNLIFVDGAFEDTCQQCDGEGRIKQPSPARSDMLSGMQNQVAFRASCERRGLTPSQEFFSLWQDCRAAQCTHPERSDLTVDGLMRVVRENWGDESAIERAFRADLSSRLAESAPSSETIDGPELRALLAEVLDPRKFSDEREPLIRNLITYIDARRATAGTTAPSTLAAAERAMERIAANQKPGCYTEEWRDVVVAGTTAAPTEGKQNEE